jgi:hypothetical protein
LSGASERSSVSPAIRIEPSKGRVSKADLKRLVKAVREPFKSFESRAFSDLSEAHIQKLFNTPALNVTDMVTKYYRKLEDVK